MGYWKKVYRLKNAIEIEEGHSGSLRPPGMKRQKRQKPTPEQMERVNQRNREKKCRRRLRAWFEPGDYFTCLTYRKAERPASMETAKEDFEKCIRKIRREYRKRGEELRWIRNIEVGTRGAWHVHLVLNRIQDTDLILAEAWKHGKAVSQLLYAKGEFAELAAYMVKTPKTDKRLRESSYSTSRNIPVPEPVKRKYRKWKTYHEVRIPKGYYLDRDSYHEGKNPYTGYPYREYTLLKTGRGHGWTG